MVKKAQKFFLYAVLALLAIMLLVIGKRFIDKMSADQKQANADANMSQEDDEAEFPVNIVVAWTGPIEERVKLSGTVKSISQVEVYSETQGILSRFRVQLGDKVQRNQVIAEVDPSRPGQQFAMNQVRTAISGTITALGVNVGDKITPQTLIVTIADLNKLQIVTALPERYSALIQIGSVAEATLEAWPDEPISVKVGLINPVVDESSRSLPIKFDIPASKKNILPGMFAAIMLIVNSLDAAVLIPTDSVIRQNNEQYVYVIEKDRAQKIDIVTGIVDGSTIQVKSGLRSGQKIVYEGQAPLQDGTKVRVNKTINSTEL